MDRIWQWAWDRHGPRYSWVMFTLAVPCLSQTYLLAAIAVVAIEDSGRYAQAAVAAVVGAVAVMYVWVLPGNGQFRAIERWAADRDAGLDPLTALRAT